MHIHVYYKSMQVMAKESANLGKRKLFLRNAVKKNHLQIAPTTLI